MWFGDYFNYLKQKGIKNVKYCGIDISNKIVDFAKEKNSSVNVIQGNVLDLSDRKHLDNNPINVSKSDVVKLLQNICEGKV